MKQILLSFLALIVVGAGCSDPGALTSSGISELPEEFYGFMNWQHTPEGSIGTVADVTAQSQIFLHFEEFDFGQEVDFGKQFSVTGTVAYNPNTFACQSANPEFTCEMTGSTPGEITGVAFEEDGVLTMKLQWALHGENYAIPAEIAVVTTDVGVLPATELYQSQGSMHASGFIGGEVDVPFTGTWFYDDYYDHAEDVGSAQEWENGEIELMGVTLEGTDPYVGSGSGWLTFFRAYPLGE